MKTYIFRIPVLITEFDDDEYGDAGDGLDLGTQEIKLSIRAGDVESAKELLSDEILRVTRIYDLGDEE